MASSVLVVFLISTGVAVVTNLVSEAIKHLCTDSKCKMKIVVGENETLKSSQDVTQ